MTIDYKYDIFLSFSSKDINIARKIFEDLTSNGLKVFFSDEAMRTKIGSQWKDELQVALTHSKHFILLCSHVSMKAKWVKREGDTFYNNFYSPGVREFVPVLIKGYHEKDLPLFYQSIQTVQQSDIHILIEIFKLSDIKQERKVEQPKDIHIDMKLTNQEAEKGCKKKINVRNKEYMVSIPINTRNGQKIRLKGKGVNGGDLLVDTIIKKDINYFMLISLIIYFGVFITPVFYISTNTYRLYQLSVSGTINKAIVVDRNFNGITARLLDSADKKQANKYFSLGNRFIDKGSLKKDEYVYVLTSSKVPYTYFLTKNKFILSTDFYDILKYSSGIGYILLAIILFLISSFIGIKIIKLIKNH